MRLCLPHFVPLVHRQPSPIEDGAGRTVDRCRKTGMIPQSTEKCCGNAPLEPPLLRHIEIIPGRN
jgi:hypothetical protein